MFEVFYTTTRLARVEAPDVEAAKRGFAAYVLYDDARAVVSDVELSFGDRAEITPGFGPPPTGGSRSDFRAWFARRDAETQSFEAGVFEDPGRALDSYLRLLATNDPWRLEGHGSLGRTLSAVPLRATLVTFDGRIEYGFEATQFVDYLRSDVIAALDPARPQDSVRVESVVDVAALHDDGLRQIASSYEAIERETRLTQRFANASLARPVFDVTFDLPSWRAYVAHRLADPARFLPPAGWTSAFPTYDGS